MMRNSKLRHRQKGLSSFGWIGIIAVFAFLIITFFKAFPMYYDNFKIKSALEGVQQDSSVDAKSRRAIWEALLKRLYINEVKYVKRENVTIERKDGKTTVTVDYKTEDDYIGNLYIGAHFVESIVIDR
jgi:hypothetical protein